MSQECNLIKLKRGLASEWQLINPILEIGEPGYEKDTQKLKIGDGVTNWNNLSYIGNSTNQGPAGPQGPAGGGASLEELETLISNTINTNLVAGNGIDLIYNTLSNNLTIQTNNTIVNTDGNQNIQGDKIFAVGEQGSFSLYNENINSTLEFLANADNGGNPVHVLLQSTDPENTEESPNTTHITIGLPNKNGTIALTTDTSIHTISNLGIVSGVRLINYDANIHMQTLSLNGSQTSFYKGTGWPTNVTKSVDLILKIIVSSPTPIVWDIVNEWYAQPPAGALSSGVHLFLLRAMGPSVIEGHYIGKKTN